MNDLLKETRSTGNACKDRTKMSKHPLQMGHYAQFFFTKIIDTKEI
jgi:hypothetical protein